MRCKCGAKEEQGPDLTWWRIFEAFFHMSVADMPHRNKTGGGVPAHLRRPAEYPGACSRRL